MVFVFFKFLKTNLLLAVLGLVAVWALPLVVVSGAIIMAVHWPHCGGFPCCRAQFLGRVGFSGCGTHA